MGKDDGPSLRSLDEADVARQVYVFLKGLAAYQVYSKNVLV